MTELVVTRRFERADESGGRRFWEIELVGARINVRRGRVEGGLIDAKRREFDTHAQAAAEAEVRILDRLREGWHEVEGMRASPTRNLRLEAAIVDAIDEAAAWSVYADWLQAHGDAFGEWLGLSLAGALADAPPQASGLWSTELLWLAGRLDLEALARFECRHGFVVRAWVGRPDVGYTSTAPERLLAALLRSAAARLLHTLTIGRVGAGSLVDALLGDRDSIMLEHLRELTLGDFVYPDEGELSWVRVGDLARVLPACPSLRTLVARGGEATCSARFDHATLESLTLETGGLAGEVCQAIVAGSLPALRTLELWFGQPRWGASATIEHLRPLLEGEAMPDLRALGLVNCEFTDAIAESLARSPRLARLERIDLSRGTLSERGARAILARASAFRRLSALDLDGNYVPPELADALTLALPNVVNIGEQFDPALGRGHGPPGYYAAVGE
ncbi:hypothetical protein ACNOYE_30360 [Nannocystaceae bacterium ST9]